MENQNVSQEPQSGPRFKRKFPVLKTIFILDVVFILPAIVVMGAWSVFFVFGFISAGAPQPSFDGPFFDNVFSITVGLFGAGVLYVLSCIPAIILTIFYKKVSRWSIPAFIFLVIFAYIVLNVPFMFDLVIGFLVT